MYRRLKLIPLKKRSLLIAFFLISLLLPFQGFCSLIFNAPSPVRESSANENNHRDNIYKFFTGQLAKVTKIFFFSENDSSEEENEESELAFSDNIRIDLSENASSNPQDILSFLHSFLSSTEGQQGFLANPFVTEINLSGNILNEEILEFIASYFPNLMILNISNFKGNRVAISEHLLKLIKSNSFVHVVQLDLSHNLFHTRTEINALEELLNAFTNLTYLNLANSVHVNITQLIPSLAHLSNLVHLNLSHNHIDQNRLVILLFTLTQFCKNIEHLDLSHNAISTSYLDAEQQESFASAFGNLEALTHLNLSSNLLTASAVNVLVATLALRSILIDLNISGNNLGLSSHSSENSDASFLSSFADLTSLVNLNIARNKLSESQIVHFIDKLSALPNIDFVDLRENSHLSDATKQKIGTSFSQHTQKIRILF